MAEVMYGPIQFLVIGFDKPEFHGQVRKALDSVMEKGVMRLLDLRFVYKDKDGNVAGLEASQLSDEERERFGGAVGALIGLGAAGEEGVQTGWERGTMAAAQRTFGMTEQDVRDIGSAIPNETAAALFLIEHLWAKDLKQTLRDSGGVLIASGLVTPEALIRIGAQLKRAAEAAEAA